MSDTDFYTVLSRHYDELFRPSPAGLAFIREEAAGGGGRGGPEIDNPASGLVLDVACGTGAWVRRLVRSGIDVYGVDLSEAMIERGREIARAEGVDPSRLAAGDMMQIDEHPGAPFDLIYCIGNSISHLPSMGSIERFVSVAAGALRDSRTLVLQYVTIGSVADGDAFELPNLRADGATLERTYRRHGASEIEFEATLRVDGEPPRRISQRLLVIDDEAMTVALRRAGFGSIDVYGGFDRSKPDETGWVRVIRCTAAPPLAR